MKIDTRNDLWKKPSTRQGWWSVALGATFVVLLLVNSLVFMPATDNAPWRHTILPFYGIAMLLVGLAAGIIRSLSRSR